MRYSYTIIFSLIFSMFCSEIIYCQTNWIKFEPTSANDNGKSVVLISGDESYRSEESLPMLAKILTTHHGFHTTVLFSINPVTKLIDPNYLQNIPGLHFLNSADLVIIQTRFRELPDDQMEYIDKYLRQGKPIIGLRTATHAFRYPKKSTSKFKEYSYDSKDKWVGGFGKQILGETWISHHGLENEATRSLLDGIAEIEKNPILKGVGVIWGPSGVYSTERLSPNTKVLLWGASTKTLDQNSPVVWEKSIMPIAWTRSYTAWNGEMGKVFTTTLGASMDFLDDDLRRLVVNAVYWTLDMEDKIPANGTNVEIVGQYKPTMFGFDGFKKDMKPSDYQ